MNETYFNYYIVATDGFYTLFWNSLKHLWMTTPDKATPYQDIKKCKLAAKKAKHSVLNVCAYPCEVTYKFGKPEYINN